MRLPHSRHPPKAPVGHRTKRVLQVVVVCVVLTAERFLPPMLWGPAMPQIAIVVLRAYFNHTSLRWESCPEAGTGSSKAQTDDTRWSSLFSSFSSSSLVVCFSWGSRDGRSPLIHLTLVDRLCGRTCGNVLSVWGSQPHTPKPCPHRRPSRTLSTIAKLFASFKCFWHPCPITPQPAD